MPWSWRVAGLYTTDPNPRVGCVVVKDGKIVGEGFHARAGEPHAEINAVRAAGAAACGATVYLTLEPCCHHGKTPPCTQALIAAGVARVVAAMQDPNPRVAGQGFAELKQAGIGAAYGLMQSEAEALNPGFIRRMQQGRPFVRVKLAASLDGRTAMASGESNGSPANRRARTYNTGARDPRPSSPASAPCWPTTHRSTCAPSTWVGNRCAWCWTVNCGCHPRPRC